MKSAETQQGLEARQGCTASVVAEDELVEVGLQVLGTDAAVGALKPG